MKGTCSSFMAEWEFGKVFIQVTKQLGARKKDLWQSRLAGYIQNGDMGRPAVKRA